MVITHKAIRLAAMGSHLKMYSALNSLFPKIDHGINSPYHFLCIAKQTGISNLNKRN